MRRWNCLCRAGLTHKDLMSCFIATGFLTQSTSPTLFSFPSLPCLLGFLQIPAVSSACCMQLWRCITEGFAERGWPCSVCIPSSGPCIYLHCKPFRPLPKGTCCRPLEGVCRGGTALDMEQHAIRLQFYLWLLPIYDICHFNKIIHSFSGAGGWIFRVPS